MPLGEQTQTSDYLVSDRWALEVCLEGLALSLDIPLQALSLSAWEKLTEKNDPIRLDQFRALIDSLPLTLPEFVEWANAHREKASDLYEAFREHLYLTPACYSSPLTKTFREHRIWAIWEGVVLLRWMRTSLGSDVGQVQVSDIAQSLGVSPISENIMGMGFPAYSIGAFIVSWPVRRFAAANMLDEPQTTSEKALDHICEVLESSGHPLKLSRNAMHSFSKLRTGITHADFHHRLAIASIALGGVADLPLTANELGRANLTAVALGLAYMATMKDYGQIPTPRADQIPTYGFRLRGINRPSRDPAKSPALLASFKADDGRLTASLDWDWEGFERGPKIVDRTNQLVLADPRLLTSEQIVEFDPKLAALDRTFSWFLDTAHTRGNAYDYETSLLLRAWSSEHVSALVKTARGALTLDRPRLSMDGDVIAEHVRQALAADLGILAFYRRSDRCAMVLGLSHSMLSQADLAKRFLALRLGEIATTPEERIQSITYRAVDTRKPQVCFSFDPVSGEAVPPQQTILRFPSEIMQPVSQNAVPINVYGRPWGILSVAGLRPYQFSSNAAATLADLADFFSTYLYNHWMLALLDTMNSTATSLDSTRATKYDILIRRIADLLLADAASLWIAHANEADRFDLLAWTGRPDLDAFLKERNVDRDQSVNDFYQRETTKTSTAREWPFTFYARENSGVSGAAHAIKSRATWLQGRLGESRFSEKWFDKIHTRGLKNGDLRSICIIPVRNGKYVQGAITLYNRDVEGYSAPWEDIVRIASDQIALMIQAIEIQSTLEQNLFAPLRHELRPTVNSLRERVARLKSLSEKMEVSDEYFRVQNDIDSYTENLDVRLHNITERRERGGQDYQKDIVLQQAEERARRHDGAIQDLRGVFNELATSRQKQTDKKLRFMFRGPRNIGVAVDRETLWEILDNLMINAVKYSVPHGEIVGQVTESSHLFEFSLSNHGETLDPEEKRRLFNKGFRGSSARRSDPKGSGLGLYYFRKLCEIYDITTEYRQQKSTVEGTSRHTFAMLIPRSKIRIRRQ